MDFAPRVGVVVRAWSQSAGEVVGLYNYRIPGRRKFVEVCKDISTDKISHSMYYTVPGLESLSIYFCGKKTSDVLAHG